MSFCSVGKGTEAVEICKFNLSSIKASFLVQHQTDTAYDSNPSHWFTFLLSLSNMYFIVVKLIFGLIYFTLD